LHNCFFFFPCYTDNYLHKKMRHFADNRQNSRGYNHHQGRSSGGQQQQQQYQGGRAGGRGGGGQYGGRGNRFQNDYYDKNQRPRSFGRNQNHSEVTIDGPLSTDRNSTERRPHSFGGPTGEFKPKKSASMIEYKENPLPNAVQVAKELVLQAANFSTMTDDETLSGRILGLAGAMADSDDLREFYDGISDIFAESLCALPAQIPAIGTLATIMTSRGEVGPLFGGRVLDRLITRFIESTTRGDVLTSKMILRAFACLTSSGCIAVEGEGSLCALLDVLLDCAYAAWSSNSLAPEGRVAIYLLAQTLPWALTVLLNSGSGNERVSRSLPLFARIVSEWVSPFSPVGSKAVFLYDTTPEDAADESAHISVGPTAGPVCWDTLWEISKSTMDVISKAQLEGTFVAPTCMSCLWELSEVASELIGTRLTIDVAAHAVQSLSCRTFLAHDSSWVFVLDVPTTAF
jgi:hypothetical protein